MNSAGNTIRTIILLWWIFPLDVERNDIGLFSIVNIQLKMSHKFPKLVRDESGLAYYQVPSGYPLYKATKRLDKLKDGGYLPLRLSFGKLYFFGPKSEDPNYLAKYEEMYGIIFEFVTTKPCNLLAMDDEQTREILYADAPPRIKAIMEKHYGMNSKKIRVSDSKPDAEFSQYLCDNDYEGYAIHEMATDKGGKFHAELMICDAANGVDFVKQVTTDKSKIESILAEGVLIEQGKLMKDAKKNAKQQHINERRQKYGSPVRGLSFGDFGDSNNEYSPKHIFKSRLFSDDEYEDDRGARSPVENLPILLQREPEEFYAYSPTSPISPFKRSDSVSPRRSKRSPPDSVTSRRSQSSPYSPTKRPKGGRLTRRKSKSRKNRK